MSVSAAPLPWRRPALARNQHADLFVQAVPINPRPFLQDLYVRPPSTVPQHTPFRGAIGPARGNSSLTVRRAQCQPGCHHPPEVGRDRVQGQTRQRRQLHEHPAQRRRGVHRPEDDRCAGAGPDPVRWHCFAEVRLAHGDTNVSFRRCNNVLHIRAAGQGANGDVRMEG